MQFTSLVLFAAGALNEDGTALLHAGRYAEAEAMYTRALAAATETDDRAVVRNNIAALYRRMGRYAEAESIYRRLLAEHQRDASPQAAILHNNLAELLRSARRLEEAEPHARRAVALLENAGPEHTRALADAIHTLGCVRFDRGDLTESAELHVRSVAVRTREFGELSPRTAAALSALAVVRGAQGRDAEAETLLRRALSIHQATGERTPELAVVWHNLAQIFVRAGQFGRAEEYSRNALHIWAETVGAGHRDYALGLTAHAYTLERQGRVSAAARLYEQALATLNGSGHPLETAARTRLAATRRAVARLAEPHVVSVEQLLRKSRR